MMPGWGPTDPPEPEGDPLTDVREAVEAAKRKKGGIPSTAMFTMSMDNAQRLLMMLKDVEAARDGALAEVERVKGIALKRNAELTDALNRADGLQARYDLALKRLNEIVDRDVRKDVAADLVMVAADHAVAVCGLEQSSEQLAEAVKNYRGVK